MKITELKNQAAVAIISDIAQLPQEAIKNTAVNTHTVQPSIPAVAPRATSDACRDPSKIPDMIIAATITAGKAAKIPANDFQGINCRKI